MNGDYGMTYIFQNLGAIPDRPNWPILIFIPESRLQREDLLNIEAALVGGDGLQMALMSYLLVKGLYF